MLNGRKQHFSEMFEIISPNNCLQSGEDAIYCSLVPTTDLHKGLWHLCSWHLHKWGSEACVSLCSGVSRVFPLREMTCCPKTLQAYWRLKWDSNLMTFAILLSEETGHTCICCKSLCKHWSSHHATPCQEVKIPFMIVLENILATRIPNLRTRV